MSTTTLIIGPEHDGQPMSLADFENAEVREGYAYELGRGVVVVNKIPNPPHFFIVNAVRRQLTTYEALNDSVELMIGGGSDCKILVEQFESERHPDLAVYLNPIPSNNNDSHAWAVWIPEIVVEVVSPGSKRRDYDEKPEEYLQFGIKEFWLVDAEREIITDMQRTRGNWSKQEVAAPAVHKTPLLPGFELNVAGVFDAVQ